MHTAWRFSGSKITMFGVDPERALLLKRDIAWQSTTAPRDSFVLRIEMRLLRDARRVLEYLPKDGCGQPRVYDMDETTRRW
jgi:hypothetical protein